MYGKPVDEKQELIDAIDRIKRICESNEYCQNCMGMTEKRIGNTIGCSLLSDLKGKIECYQSHNGGTEALDLAIKDIEIYSVWKSIVGGHPDKKGVRDTLNNIKYILNPSETIEDGEIENLLEGPPPIPERFSSLVE